MRLATTTLMLAAAVAMGGAASAQVNCQMFYNDNVFGLVLSDSLFVAEGRIGDRGGPATFEIDLGPDTSNPAVTAQYDWPNGSYVPFALTYDMATGLVTFTVDGVVLDHTTEFTNFDAIFIRTRAAIEGSHIIIRDLAINGAPIGCTVRAGGLYGGLQILQLYGAGVRGSFELTGSVKMLWEGATPQNSQLAFQIKVANMFVVSAEDQSWGQVKSLYR